MSADPRRDLGRRGEEFAADHLERLGFRLLARNHRTRHGELDLVACDDETLVFCEVKTCRAGAGVSPWDSLHPDKRRQVRRMASAWLRESTARPRARVFRFDAIGVVLDREGGLVSLDHLEAAF